MASMSIIWMNGSLLEAADASLSVLDRGLTWGLGLFETLRAYRGKLWALDEHYARMKRGGEVLEIRIPSMPEMMDALTSVMDANSLSDCGVRVMVTAGTGGIDPHSPTTGEPSVIATAWPLGDYTALYEAGAHLITVPELGRSLPGIKSTSYAASVAGRLAAQRVGADDALFVSGHGTVLEATASNVMIVLGSTIVTAPVADGILPGVTRSTVLDVASALGLHCVEREISVAELVEADEVLLTSTLREVYPMGSLDGQGLKLGPRAAELRGALRDRILQTLS